MPYDISAPFGSINISQRTEFCENETDLERQGEPICEWKGSETYNDARK